MTVCSGGVPLSVPGPIFKACGFRPLAISGAGAACEAVLWFSPEAGTLRPLRETRGLWTSHSKEPWGPSCREVSARPECAACVAPPGLHARAILPPLCPLLAVPAGLT